MNTDPPFIDEHQVLVAAPAATLWRSIGALTGSRHVGAEAYGRLIAVDPPRATGTPLTKGATIPGFLVAEADPEHHLRLTGRHRFSRYTLDLTLTPEASGTRLIARTNAELPGFLGGIYRLLVIESTAHHILVRSLLRTLARRAERDVTSSGPAR